LVVIRAKQTGQGDGGCGEKTKLMRKKGVKLYSFNGVDVLVRHPNLEHHSLAN